MSNVVNIAYRADIKNLQAELARIPGITRTEATRMVRELAQANRAASKSAVGAVQAVDGATKRTLGDVRKLTAGIGGEIGGVSGRLVNLGEGMAALGPAAAAGVALVGLGMLSVASVKLIGELRDLTADFAKAAPELEKLGLLSTAAAAELQAADLTMQAAEKSVKGLAAELYATSGLNAAMEQLYSFVGDTAIALNNLDSEAGRAAAKSSGLIALGSALLGLGGPAIQAAFLQNVTAIRATIGVEKERQDQMDKLGVSTRTVAAALADKAEAEKANDAAAKAEPKRTQARVEADKAWRDVTKELVAAQGQLAALVSAANADTLSDQQRIVLGYEAQLASIDAVAERYGALTDAESAREAVRARMARDLEALATTQADAEAAAHQRRMDEMAAEQDAARAAAFSKVGFALDAAGQIGDILSTQAEGSRRLAYFEIVVSTAAAMAKAIEQYGMPWGLIPAGLSAAYGAAQLSAVSAAKYHTGGLLAREVTAPDEVTITAKRDEGILTARGVAAVGGEAGLSRANRGEAMQPILYVEQVYQHRGFGAFVQDNARMTSSPLRREIRAAPRGRVGHRERR